MRQWVTHAIIIFLLVSPVVYYPHGMSVDGQVIGWYWSPDVKLGTLGHWYASSHDSNIENRTYDIEVTGNLSSINLISNPEPDFSSYFKFVQVLPDGTILTSANQADQFYWPVVLELENGSALNVFELSVIGNNKYVPINYEQMSISNGIYIGSFSRNSGVFSHRYNVSSGKLISEELNSHKGLQHLILSVEPQSPTIDSPNDLDYKVGSENISVEWEINIVHNSNYKIYNTGELIRFGFLDKSGNVTLGISQLKIGIYYFIITVLSEIGLISSDTLKIIVTTNGWSNNTITISTDGHFSKFASAGIGTIKAPYIIEGLSLSTLEGPSIIIRDTFSHFTLRNNTIKGLDIFGGIVIENVQNGIIENNIISDITTNGIQITKSSNIEIRDNYICNNGRFGILSGDSNQNLIISHNKVCNNNFGGISIADSIEVQIVNNTINSNNGTGLSLSLQEAIITNNQIQGNAWNGIFLVNSKDVEISKNEISENSLTGIFLSSNVNIITITENVFFNIGLTGIKITDGSNISITLNDLNIHNIKGTVFEDDGLNNYFINNYLVGATLKPDTRIIGSAENEILNASQIPNHFTVGTINIEIISEKTNAFKINISINEALDSFNHDLRFIYYYVEVDTSKQLIMLTYTSFATYTWEFVNLNSGNYQVVIVIEDSKGFMILSISEIFKLGKSKSLPIGSIIFVSIIIVGIIILFSRKNIHFKRPI